MEWRDIVGHAFNSRLSAIFARPFCSARVTCDSVFFSLVLFLSRSGIRNWVCDTTWFAIFIATLILRAPSRLCDQFRLLLFWIRWLFTTRAEKFHARCVPIRWAPLFFCSPFRFDTSVSGFVINIFLRHLFRPIPSEKKGRRIKIAVSLVSILHNLSFECCKLQFM